MNFLFSLNKNAMSWSMSCDQGFLWSWLQVVDHDHKKIKIVFLLTGLGHVREGIIGRRASLSSIQSETCPPICVLPIHLK